MICYLDLLKSFENNPRDIITIPITKREGKWFYVYAENGRVIVTGAKEKFPKCSISKNRILQEKECEVMYELYLLRKQGKQISAEAMQSSRNQVYWYGIFSDLGY
ncbi:MAG: hypothetical protein J6A11_05280 [Lachnospiraceae bacterium]|nr:hypothetical protein [Lachnospiraceae bacterium]